MVYLAAAPEPLRSMAVLNLDTGLRTSELLNLEWADVHLGPANGARFGYLHIPGGKSRNARRNIPLAESAKVMLLRRSQQATSVYVFPSETGKPYRV